MRAVTGSSQLFKLPRCCSRLLFPALLLVLVHGAVAPARAHYPWLTVLHDDPITFEIGWGHDFPTDGIMEVERLAGAALIMPDGEKHALTLQAGVQHQLGTAVDDGVYLLLAEQTPGYYSRTPEGGRRGSRAEYPAAVGCSLTHNTMKALISKGPGGDPDRIVGHPLEIVPLVDPGTLAAGDILPLRLLLHGHPFSGEVAATWAGYKGEGEFAQTLAADAQGRVELPLIEGGHWLVLAEVRQDYPEPARCDQSVYRAIFTFHTRRAP